MGFLTHLSVERGRSPRTISAYSHDLRTFAGFLERRGIGVLSVGSGDVVAYANHLAATDLAASSRTRMLVSVRGLYRYLVAEGECEVDPTARLETPRRPDALPKALSQSEVIRILDALAADCAGGDPVALRNRALVEFLYGTGARVSEACGLRFGDVDLEAALVRVIGKRDKERIVPLGAPARHAMEHYLDRGRPMIIEASSTRGRTRDDADAVFLGVRGRRLSRQAVWEVIRLSASRAAVTAQISPHVMRHSCATHLLEGGADVRVVAELLGHASVSTTQIYTRVANDLLFDAYRSAHPRAAKPNAGRTSPSVGN
ncbi:MAG: site-specific tyrosine recombinase XerD [Microthrixaceae bacterium]